MDYKGAKDRTILRSRITAQYDVRRCLLDPYVSVEYGCGLNYTANKWKFMVGTDIKINKQNVIDAFYRYQTEDDDEDPNGHIIGVGYKYKF
jgi:opacity protein-like surface antigen